MLGYSSRQEQYSIINAAFNFFISFSKEIQIIYQLFVLIIGTLITQMSSLLRL